MRLTATRLVQQASTRKEPMCWSRLTRSLRRRTRPRRDKLGRNYVDAHLRPIAEAAAVFGTEAEAAGWLHDILEDTATTARRSARAGGSRTTSLRPSSR